MPKLSSKYMSKSLSAAATLAVVIMLATTAAQASTLIVTSALDRPETGRLTLREALAQSRLGDTIVFDDTLQGQIIRLESPRGPLIANDVTIDTGKVVDISIDGSGIITGPFFRAASCNIHGLSFLGGRTTGISLTGSSNLTRCRFRGNLRALEFNGFGSLDSCTFESNGNYEDREPDAGILSIRTNQSGVNLSHCTFSNDFGLDLLVRAGKVLVSDCHIVNNGGSRGPGGVLVNSGDLTLKSSTIENCRYGISSEGNLRMRNTTVRNIGIPDRVYSMGIGINYFKIPGNLYMDNCTVENCTGIGIHFSGHDLIMNRCKVLSSSGVQVNAVTDGGRIIFNESTFAHNRTSGISLTNNTLPGNGATFAIRNSTISDNITDSPYARLGEGAGVAVRTGPWNPITVTIENSTISGNSVVGPARNGGGLSVISPHSILDEVRVKVISCTIANNRALEGDGGGIYVSPLPNAILELDNTLVANNQSLDQRFPDIFGSVRSHGFNLIERIDGSDGYIATDQTGTVVVPLNPMLGKLRDNGGPTETMALLPPSPARYTGNPQFLGHRDQRGVIRKEPDTGAYSFN